MFNFELTGKTFTKEIEGIPLPPRGRKKRSVQSSTPLHLAAYNFEIVKYLVEKGAAINIVDENDTTPLLKAANQKNWNVVSYLIEKAANVELADKKNNTPMHEAAKSGVLNIVKSLVEKGADFNARNDYGYTPIHLAALNGHLNILMYLIDEKGANFTVKDNYGKTTLHLAVSSGKLDVVKYLVDVKGVDFNVKDKDGKTLLALVPAWATELIQYLESKGARRSRRSVGHEEVSDSHNRELFNAQNYASSSLHVTSEASRPSSWIGDLARWVKGKLFNEQGLFYAHANTGLKEQKQHSSLFSPILQQAISSKEQASHEKVKGQKNQFTAMQNVDVNGTIMLLDLFIRKITGQKYISTESRSMSLPEAQAYALSIIEKFEQVLNKTAVKSGISAKNLNFNRLAVSTEIAQHLRNGKFSELPKTLYASAKEACPQLKQTDKFLAQLKSPLEEIVNKTTKDVVQPKSVQDFSF